MNILTKLELFQNNKVKWQKSNNNNNIIIIKSVTIKQVYNLWLYSRATFTLTKVSFQKIFYYQLELDIILIVKKKLASSLLVFCSMNQKRKRVRFYLLIKTHFFSPSLGLDLIRIFKFLLLEWNICFVYFLFSFYLSFIFL